MINIVNDNGMVNQSINYTINYTINHTIIMPSTMY